MIDWSEAVHQVPPGKGLYRLQIRIDKCYIINIYYDGNMVSPKVCFLLLIRLITHAKIFVGI